ncbi:MAG: hypothetical protein HYX27_06270 [Acidobacteria bacterium]|nr:hypothetical protein [Acidobacteriota bacterium]
MKAYATVTLALLGTALFAQDQRTWNGTLVDATCQSTRIERKESRQTGADRTVTTTRTETTRTDCPVTVTTTTFGILTSDGRFVRFDEPSNTRVVEIVRTNKVFVERPTTRVKVIGAASGDVAIVQSLEPEGIVQREYVQVDRVDNDMIFDVRYHGDRGKLVVSANRISFEDISESKHSHTWNYSQIKELRREGSKEIKLEPYSGDSFEFKFEGRSMSDNVYNEIANRIAAARNR